MTRSKQSSPGPVAGGLWRYTPWAALGIVAVAMALMAWMGGPSRLLSAVARRVAGTGGALELTILHSNDTYGYVFPCG